MPLVTMPTQASDGRAAVKLHKTLVFNAPFYVELSASIAAMLVYLSGIGRFRFVVVCSGFLIVRAIFVACSATMNNIVLVPIVVIALMLDLKYGALYPVYDSNNILLAGIVLVICEIMVRKIMLKKLGSIKSFDHFQICPHCKTIHSELVTWCGKCGYNEPDFGLKNNEANFIGQIISGKNEGNPDYKHEILYQMELPTTIACYKNGNRELRNHLFMTKDCVAIVDIRGGTAWRDGDVISYSEITTIAGEMKKSFIGKSPFMTIRCKNGNVFEIVLTTLDDYKQQIMQIQSVAKNSNGEIMIENNLPDKPVWRM